LSEVYKTAIFVINLRKKDYNFTTHTYNKSRLIFQDQNLRPRLQNSGFERS